MRGLPSTRISFLVSSLTMANRWSPLRLTYVESELGYDRYLSHLSAQLPQRFRPPFLLVAHYGVLQYFAPRCSPFTLENSVRHLQRSWYTYWCWCRCGWIRAQKYWNPVKNNGVQFFIKIATMTLHRSIDHDDTHLDTPFLSAPWWSTGFLYHPYHCCNQAWTWIGRCLVHDSSTIHRMLRCPS